MYKNIRPDKDLALFLQLRYTAAAVVYRRPCGIHYVGVANSDNCAIVGSNS